VAAVAYVQFHDHHQRRKIARMPRPMTIPEKVEHLKRRCHHYIHATAINPKDVMRKRHLLEPQIHEHCHRHLPPLLAGGAHPHHVAKKCVAICEKICDAFNIDMKPRCEGMDRVMGGRYHAHANYAVNLFDINYQHAPTTRREIQGRLF